MIITGMAEYESVCKNALVKWYNSHNETKITLENVFVVWACKTLQNYKALLSTTVSGDGESTPSTHTTAISRSCTRTCTAS